MHDAVTVSVLIPTFRRPEGLRATVQSVLAQTRRPDEIIVIDNSPEGSARCIVRNAEAVARCPVVYVHEPRPGVSNARNAGFAAATSRYVAWIDDDEIASLHWLEALMDTAADLKASVVFGPLTAELQDTDGLRAALARRLYSRTGPEQDAILTKPYGCGNSLVDRYGFEFADQPFDARLNRSGGEDDLFFAELAEQGARFAWSAAARGIEVVEVRRTQWRNLLARSFAFGQGATQGSARGRATDWLGIAFWMAVGLAQMAVYGPMALIAAALHLPQAAALLDRSVQAAGKLFWFDALEPKFYGMEPAADPGLPS